MMKVMVNNLIFKVAQKAENTCNPATNYATDMHQ